MGKIARKEIQAQLEALAHVAGLKVATDHKSPGLYLDYLAPNGWQVVDNTTGHAVFGYGRMRGPEIMQTLNHAKRVIEYVNSGAAPTIGVKPASMFDAQVIAAMRRFMKAYDSNQFVSGDVGLTGEDIRLLKGWVGR